MGCRCLCPGRPRPCRCGGTARAGCSSHAEGSRSEASRRSSGRRRSALWRRPSGRGGEIAVARGWAPLQIGPEPRRGLREPLLAAAVVQAIEWPIGPPAVARLAARVQALLPAPCRRRQSTQSCEVPWGTQHDCSAFREGVSLRSDRQSDAQPTSEYFAITLSCSSVCNPPSGPCCEPK